MESFERDQIGSSAMPYKQNPMKSERVCSLARDLISSAERALQTVADQGLERTLDDSAIRRSDIPDSFLCASAILSILQVCVFLFARKCKAADALEYLRRSRGAGGSRHQGQAGIAVFGVREGAHAARKAGRQSARGWFGY